jgi:hypothetical protein
MDARFVVGVALVAGLVIFMVGAVRWKLSYDQPYDKALPIIHADKGRRVWIHVWMIIAMLVTPAGLAGFATLPADGPGRALAAMAAAVYAIGAGAWVVSLAFRLTVGAWAAERAVAGAIPETFPPFDTWAESLYVVHMAASYGSFAILGGAVLTGGVAPVWVGWLGVGWGALFLAGFVVNRIDGPLTPPFWAHAYTGLLGVVLLAVSA